MTLATGGDNTYDEDGWRYHEFTTVGSADLTVTEAGDVEILAVAGGAGGGAEGGDADFGAGGGGAGGVLVTSDTFAVGAVSVDVGGGGAGTATTAGGPGGESTIAAHTAVGGGSGGAFGDDVGNGDGIGGDGGSGGGTSGDSGPTGGSGTAGQGNDGGSSQGEFSPGGGGGAGAAGAAGVDPQAGAGGDGITVWGIYTVGGGGGGGAAGSGGGTPVPGAGGDGGGGTGADQAGPTPATAGTPNTGGGGGGGSGTAAGDGADGGSGIVVVRYQLAATMTGQLSAGGTLTGSMTTAPAVDMTGVFDGGGTLTGTMTATAPVVDMAGVLDGGGVLTGQLTTTLPDVEMTGTLSAGGTLTGALTVIAPDADMTGLLNGGGLLAGALTTTAPPPPPQPVTGCGWNPTTDQILDLDGVRRRADGFRFELLDSDEEFLGELHPDRSRPPTISNDVTNSIPRKMRSFHLPNSELQDVNIVSDRVRVVMELQNGAEFPLGTFLWADDSRPVRSWQADEHFSSLSDKMLMFNQDFIGSIGWGPGAGGDQGVHIAMLFLITQVIGLFDIIHLGDESRVRIADSVGWSPGTSWHRALSELGDLVGFAAPWFNRDGRFNFGIPPEPDQATPVATYTPGSRIIADSIITSDDLLKAPNLFGVYDSGPSSTRIGRYQLPSSAPHSIANRGFAVAMVESRQGLNSTGQANRAARSLASTKGVAFDWVEFQSTADPRHDAWDVIALQLRDDDPLQNWLETSWSLECRSGGLMSHTARRVH